MPKETSDPGSKATQSSSDDPQERFEDEAASSTTMKEAPPSEGNPAEESQSKSTLSADELYKQAVLLDKTQQTREDALLVIQYATDAYEAFGATNQTKKVELQAIIARAQGLVPPANFKALVELVQGKIIGKVFPKSPKLRFAFFALVAVGILATVTITVVKIVSELRSAVVTTSPLKPQPTPSLRWQPVTIQSSDRYKTSWRQNWTDVQWFEGEGWLSGILAEGGGGGLVGSGVLLHTTDKGSSWTEIDQRLLPGGKGKFSWGPGPTGDRNYEWTEAGPIKTIELYPRRLGDQKFSKELWLTTSTGIYFSGDGGGKWQRMTPPPNDPLRYAFFLAFAGVEDNREIYVSGWQGIAHWSRAKATWSLQLPTYDYPINKIAITGGSENRSVWAVGRSGVDEEGKRGSESHGAIYHLSWPANKWEKVALTGITFRPTQSFSDIMVIDYETVFAIGDKGLMLRGSLENGTWSWKKLELDTTINLNSLAYREGRIWIVGEAGLIMESADQGNTWARTQIKDEAGNLPNLKRLRFFPDGGWIVGQGIVLKSSAP